MAAAPSRPHALTELARRLQRLAREESKRHGAHLERWRVLHADPLLIEQVEGKLTLEEGDPDFTVGDGLRQHAASYGLEPDDQVLVVRAGGDWYAVDAASTAQPTAGGLEAGSYTISKDTPLRGLDPTSATTKDVANVLATLIRDLGGA